MTRRRVAVVGGGMAGLMAALRLRQLGAAVTVYEAHERPGGMIRTVRREGFTFEMGASALSVSPDLMQVLEGAGPLPEVIRQAPGSQRRFLVHDGRVVPVPVSPPEFVATPLLSFGGRMRFLKEPFVPRGPFDPEETMAGFTRRRFGEEGAARIFDPLVSGTTGGDPEQLLARYTFPMEVEYERRSGSVLKGRMRAARATRRAGLRSDDVAPWSCAEGLQALPRAIAASLGSDFLAGTRVDAVRMGADAQVRVECDGVGSRSFDGVILAVSAPSLGRMHIDAPDSDSLAQVTAMPHASLVVVALGYRRDAIGHPLEGHGLLAATSERRRILGALFTSSQFPSHAPPGHVLLTVSLGGARHPSMVSLSDLDVRRIAHEEMRDLLGATAQPVIAEVARWPAALPLAVAGHAARIDAAARLETTAPRIAFAGTWHDGLMLRDVMTGGVSAADRLLTRI